MDYTEAGYKIYGLWCEAGRPGTPEWGVSSIANIIRELDSRGIEPVTQAAPVSPRPLDELLQPLKDACDRDWKDETPEQIVAIAANAIYWRGYNQAWGEKELAQKCDSVTLTPSSKEKI